MANRQDYEKAMAMAEAGQYEQAFSAIAEYLRGEPQDGEALNDAGALLHCLGRSAQAIEYVIKARKLRPDDKQVLMNLLEISLAACQPRQAEQLFEEAQRMGILNPELMNRTAKLFLDQGDKAGAVEVLLRSLDCWGGQEILEHMLTVIKSKRPKLAFICGGDGTMFLNPLSDYLAKRFEVRFFDGKTEQELYALMQWSDITWFEWCTNLAVIGLRGPKVCKAIVRLHRYEAYLDYVRQANWSNVDVLITVGNSYVKQAMFDSIGKLPATTKMVTIPNGVSLDKIEFVDRPRGKNLACVGYINMRKNPMFLLQCMRRLLSIDSGYKLYFAGVFQDSMLEQYIKHMVEKLELGGSVFFDGWQGDVAGWLGDKHYVVSASIAESQGMGLMEGIAAGLKPVIHNFAGASEIYPQDYLFNTAEEFCEMIVSGGYEPKRYRQFIEQNYPQDSQSIRVNEVIVELEKEIDSQKQIVTADSMTINAFGN